MSGTCEDYPKDLLYKKYIQTTLSDFDSLKQVEYSKAVAFKDSLLKLYDLRDGFWDF